MRLTVTPLGAAGRSPGRVARAVVDYLEGTGRNPVVGVLGGGLARSNHAVSAYYADSIEGPGRWLGAGAAFRGLSGQVDRDSFQRVLEGRHPRTGERLVLARGSSQRSHLAVGTAARFDTAGQALYTESDAARLLGQAQSEVADLVSAGVGTGENRADDASWMRAVDGGVHGPLIPDSEITRHLELASAPVDVEAVRAAGSAEELLTVREAAYLLRVTERYVRRLCAAGERPADDRPRASLPSVRDDRGRFGIRREHLAEFAERRKPPIARVGFDLTLTVEKSVALLALLVDGERQGAVVRALHRANETAIHHLDHYASVARRRGSAVATEGLLVASYFHGTSRSLDPHPHHHNIVANAVVDDEGGVRTLDAPALYRHAPAAAALATASLRWELRDLGLGWWRRDNGVWEVAGVTEDAIREFSRRREEMDEIRTALEERLGRTITHGEEDTIALSTRPDKNGAVNPVDLRDEWLNRAYRVGLDIEACLERPDRGQAFEVLPDSLQNALFEDLADPANGLCAESNTFDRGDVLRAIADWSMLAESGEREKVLLPPAEVERLTARFCASHLVAELAGTSGVIRRRDGAVVHGGQAEPLFTTLELLEVQERLVSTFLAGIGAGAAVVAASELDTSLSAVAGLGGEQADLVRSWLTSGDRVQCAIGRAGTGKTTTMRTAAALWRAAGFRVIGASIKAEAARQLHDEAGIEADTVALLLARERAGARALDARTVLIVDEASTIGDRDLLALCEHISRAGAALRLIGDPAQHGSVPAGGTFAELALNSAGDTPQLTVSRRLTDPGEARRADLIRDGRIDEAINEFLVSGQLELTESEAMTFAAVLGHWFDERTAGRPHPMVHGRKRERAILNSLAQRLLIAEGAVDPTRSVRLRDGRRLRVGDEVVARHGDRAVFPVGNPEAWLRNGTTGCIAAVRPAGDDAAADEIDISTAAGTLTCQRATFDRSRGGVDLAYAMTSYAVQGSTRDASTSAVTPATSRSEIYVDVTRGRHSNRLFGTRPVEPLEDDLDEHLPTLREDLAPVLRGRLARGSGHTALGTEPTARLVSRLTARRSLAGLCALRRRDPGVEIDRAIERTISAVRRLAAHEPPAALVGVLPPMPSSPHLAERWRRTAGDVAVYLATHLPDPRSGQPGLAGVIGSRPDDEGATEWDEVSEAVCSTAVAIASRALLDRAEAAGDPVLARTIRQQPDWLVQHLDRLARRGGLGVLDVGALAHTVSSLHGRRTMPSAGGTRAGGGRSIEA